MTQAKLADLLRSHAEFVFARCEDGEVIAHDMREMADVLERLQAALVKERGHGETMPCGHNSRWLVYGNPVDVNSERHCLFCEVERLGDALLRAIEGKREAWDEAKRIDELHAEEGARWEAEIERLQAIVDRQGVRHEHERLERF